MQMLKISLIALLGFLTTSTALAQVAGCTDPNAANFDPLATIDDGSCFYYIYGCTDPAALNFDPAATMDNGSCVYVFYGCTDPNAVNYNPIANADDGSCYYYTYGCTDPIALNYDPSANFDDGSCQYIIYGCTDPGADNYNPDAQVDDGSCYYSGTWGCTDPSAANYDPWANYDDGSCYYYYYGCTDASAINYDPTANMDDGSCQYNYDCYGEINGEAYFDNCGECVGGNTGLEPCVIIGINQMASQFNSFRIIPNPNNGNFQLKGIDFSNPYLSVKFTDLAGRVVAHFTSTYLMKMRGNFNLSLENGIYFIRISEGNVSKTERVLIEN